MEKLLEILNDIDESIDYTKEEHLIDDGLLDSLAILSLVSEIEEAFDVEVGPANLIPDNFNSAASLWKMIEYLQQED